MEPNEGTMKSNDTHWKSNEIKWKANAIHWKPMESIEQITNTYWKSVAFHWRPMNWRPMKCVLAISGLGETQLKSKAVCFVTKRHTVVSCLIFQFCTISGPWHNPPTDQNIKLWHQFARRALMVFLFVAGLGNFRPWRNPPKVQDNAFWHQPNERTLMVCMFCAVLGTFRSCRNTCKVGVLCLGTNSIDAP